MFHKKHPFGNGNLPLALTCSELRVDGELFAVCTVFSTVSSALRQVVAHPASARYSRLRIMVKGVMLLIWIRPWNRSDFRNHS